MATMMIQDNYLTDIGDAIRERSGETTTYKPSEMAAAIKNIKGDMENLIVSNPSDTTYSNNLVNNVRDYGFAYIGYGLVDGWDINLPYASILGHYAFYHANLNTLQLPEATTIVGDGCFMGTQVYTLKIPKLNQIYGGALFAEAQIPNLIWPSGITTIPTDAFTNATLYNLIIPSDSFIQLGVDEDGSDSISYCARIVYIYVPSALLDLYKTDVNWGKYANGFRAIEDYPEIQALIE